MKKLVLQAALLMGSAAQAQDKIYLHCLSYPIWGSGTATHGMIIDLRRNTMVIPEIGRAEAQVSLDTEMFYFWGAGGVLLGKLDRFTGTGQMTGGLQLMCNSVERRF
jgi:hypothetical protein